MFRLLLLGMFVVLFMDEGIQFCNSCEHFDGSICHGGMKSCWKFNLYLKNRSCATDHYYFSDLTTGRYLFRYTTLSCRPCDEGMFQVFHDLLRETTCCTNQNRCNTGRDNLDITRILGAEPQDEIVYGS
uniref:Uncharacterized protein n=1 Tax=Piliocolobus tephrosceles TaxID=591936 RepID=A0A8C9GDC5_9PRIM